MEVLQGVVSMKRSTVRIVDFTVEDWAICAVSKERFQMVAYDKADEDDMAVLALMRAAGLPKGALSLGVSEIQEQMNEQIRAHFEHAVLKEGGVKFN